jgi:ATP-dependent Clp protease ATP-binding subunit ClpB
MVKELLVNLDDVVEGKSSQSFNYNGVPYDDDGDVEKICSILGQSRYCNIVYHGPSGAGKTAALFGIVERKLKIVNNHKDDVRLPLHMLDRKFLMLDVNELFSINDPAVMKNKIERVFMKLNEPGDNILVVEDMTDLISGVENNQFTDFIPRLIAALSKKQFHAILMVRQEPGSDSLRKVLGCHSEMTELFSLLECSPPDKERTAAIMRATKAGLENHFGGLSIADSANDEIVNLTFHYQNLSIYTRAQPARSLRLRDQIASIYLSRHQTNGGHEIGEWRKFAEKIGSVVNKKKRVEGHISKASTDLLAETEKLKADFKSAQGKEPTEADIVAFKSEKMREHEQFINAASVELGRLSKEAIEAKGSFNSRLTLTLDDVRNIFSELSGVPIKNLTADETTRVIGMADRLKTEIFGQDDAIDCISNAVLTAKAGLNNPNAPIASFMIFGSSGIGKTFVCQKLAEDLFEDPGAITRLDMSEYQEKHTISRMIGAPPGYAGFGDGGLLCNAIRRRPYQVVLFDEIEKAHPDVFLILLQMLDSGRLSDELGVVDCRNTIIMMTTNLGGSLSFDSNRNSDNSNDAMKDAARKIFPQELMNRVDSYLLFKALSPEAIKKIIRNQIKSKNTNMQKHGRRIVLDLPDAEIERIVSLVYRIEEGARQVQKFVQTNFINASAKDILARGAAGGVVKGRVVLGTGDQPSFTWTISDFSENSAKIEKAA